MEVEEIKKFGSQTREVKNDTSIASQPFLTKDDFNNFLKIEYSKEYKKIKTELSGLKKDFTESKEDALKSTNKNVEILAIFVALFTFISIDMQVFKFDISMLSAIGITLLTLGSLLFFILILHWIINKIEFSGLFLGLLVMIFVLVILGIFCVSFDYKNYTSKIKEKFYDREQVDYLIKSVDVNKPLNEFKNCILQNQKYWPCLK